MLCGGGPFSFLPCGVKRIVESVTLLVHVLGGHSPPVDTQPPSLLQLVNRPVEIPAGVQLDHPKLQHPHLADRLQLTDLKVQLVYMRTLVHPPKTTNLLFSPPISRVTKNVYRGAHLGSKPRRSVLVTALYVKKRLRSSADRRTDRRTDGQFANCKVVRTRWTLTARGHSTARAIKCC